MSAPAFPPSTDETGAKPAPTEGSIMPAEALRAFLHSNTAYAVISDTFYLYKADALEILKLFPAESIDLIFADPPYFLSNNGTTCHAGRRVSVNKGEWDRSRGFHEDVAFHRAWITQAYRVLKPSGTIWISGTIHNIYQCGYLLQETGFHLLNDICWYKPNAAPNLSCTTFAHAHETLLWAKKSKDHRHYFAYQLMKNGSFPEDMLKNPGKQMRSVWSIPTPTPSEKIFGKHPAQKPLALLMRILMASSKEGDVILDPFAGAGTTGIAALKLGKRLFIGIEREEAYLEIARKRAEHLISQSQLFQ